MAALKNQDAYVKKLRDSIQTKNKMMQEINPYILFLWLDLSVKSDCVCIDQFIVLFIKKS